MSIFQRLFFEYAYAVGCRQIALDEVLPSSSMKGQYTVLKPTEFQWYADPFCFHKDGKDYVFFEVFEKLTGKGCIGYSVFDGEKFSPVEIVLRESFHLSYPNVFTRGDQVFMIPETNEAGQIRVYEALDFPTKWTLKKVLVDNIRAVDTSFLKTKNNQVFLYTHIVDGEFPCLKFFSFDLDNLSCSEVAVPAAVSNERPAGNVLTVQEKDYRLLQDCSKVYGEKIKVYSVDNAQPDTYCETYVGDIIAGHLHTDTGIVYERTHTLTRSGGIEAVDFCYQKFYLLKPILRVWFRLRKLFERN